MTKAKNPLETRRTLQLDIARLDLARAQAISDLLASKEMDAAKEVLRGLYDAEAPRGSPHNDVNALAALLLEAFDNGGPIAANLVAVLENVVDPEAAAARRAAQEAADPDHVDTAN